MAKPILTDEKLDRAQHLFQPPPPRPKGGRKRVEDRRVLTGILFILRTCIPWHELPLEMGCGSGMTARRRVLEWQELGLWQKLLLFFVEERGQSGELVAERPYRTQPMRPRQTRQQIQFGDRRARHPTGRRAQRCQWLCLCDSADDDRGRECVSTRQTYLPGRPRRQSLRQQREPNLLPHKRSALRHRSVRSTRDCAEPKALGHRAHLLLAQEIPRAGPALRAAR